MIIGEVCLVESECLYFDVHLFLGEAKASPTSNQMDHVTTDEVAHRMYNPFHGFWESFVTIGSCNHLMRVISTYVGNTNKVRSREDDDYSNATIKYGV